MPTKKHKMTPADVARINRATAKRKPAPKAAKDSRPGFEKYLPPGTRVVRNAPDPFGGKGTLSYVSVPLTAGDKKKIAEATTGQEKDRIRHARARSAETASEKRARKAGSSIPYLGHWGAG